VSPPQAEWSNARRNAFFAVLCVIGLISFIDRQIITILIDPIKTEFKASDTAMGALTGIIFSGFYALAAIPLTRLADRFSRRNLIAAALAFWSVMTSLGGYATNFAMLAMTRVGVAVGEAGAGPASHSLVSDLYPLNRRGTALGLLSAAQSVGIGLGVFLGGALATAFDWRTSFLIVGIPGLLVAAALLLFFREPPRGLSEGLAQVEEQPSFLETVVQLWLIPTYRYLFLTVGLAGFCGYGVLAWGPSLLARVHGVSPAAIGLWFGGAVGLSLVIGHIMAGWLGDRLGARDLRAYLWVGGGGPILAFIPGLVFAFSDDWHTAIAGLFLYQLFLSTHIPTCYMLVQSLVRQRMRAMAMVVVSFASSILGAGVAPLVIGGISDLLTPAYGDEAIRYALGGAIIATLLSGSAALLGTRHVRRDFEALQAGSPTATTD
jgi:MFS family permease